MSARYGNKKPSFVDSLNFETLSPENSTSRFLCWRKFSSLMIEWEKLKLEPKLIPSVWDWQNQPRTAWCQGQPFERINFLTELSYRPCLPQPHQHFDRPNQTLKQPLSTLNLVKYKRLPIFKKDEDSCKVNYPFSQLDKFHKPTFLSGFRDLNWIPQNAPHSNPWVSKISRTPQPRGKEENLRFNCKRRFPLVPQKPPSWDGRENDHVSSLLSSNMQVGIYGLF